MSSGWENNATVGVGGEVLVDGVNGRYSYGSYTSGTPCTNTVYGDPVSGTSKPCYVQ
ncbi:hypothetical protein ACGFY9_39430 [Streptomyces sp. NPDC048504]|uniref:hypothetical protein n=1 Tax=Streptomyces sp. NPDC048504 TaxID=3365559 RepID=UPI003719EC11